VVLEEVGCEVVEVLVMAVEDAIVLVDCMAVLVVDEGWVVVIEVASLVVIGEVVLLVEDMAEELDVVDPEAVELLAEEDDDRA